MEGRLAVRTPGLWEKRTSVFRVMERKSEIYNATLGSGCGVPEHSWQTLPLCVLVMSWCNNSSRPKRSSSFGRETFAFLPLGGDKDHG